MVQSVYRNILADKTKEHPANTLYENRFKSFEQEGYRLVRKIIISEKMALLRRGEIDVRKRQKQYVRHMKGLLDDLGGHDVGIKIDIITTVDNETAFNQFRNANLHNPEYMEKYVAFVNGSYQGVNEKRSDLVKEIYKRFGNIKMFVEKVSNEEEELLFDSPE